MGRVTSPQSPGWVDGYDSPYSEEDESSQLASPMLPHTSATLKDSRVNFRLGTGGLQAKANYRVDSCSMAQPPAHPANNALLVLLVQLALLSYEESKAECLRLTGAVQPERQDLPKPLTIEYSSQQSESTRNHLEVFAKHSREYMAVMGSGRCACTHPRSRYFQASFWQIHWARISLGYLSLSPWWICCVSSLTALTI